MKTQLLEEHERTRFKEMDVLFAEDDPVVVESMRTILGHYFREVTVCRDGREALETCRNRPFDLAILDVRMPGLDGLEAARILREESIDLPILILTSHEDVATLRRAIPLGLLDYLVKPLEIEAFEEALRRFLSHAEGKEEERISLNRHCFLEKSRHRILYYDDPNAAQTLSANEYALLELLVRRKGGIVHLEEIDAVIYQGEMTSHAIRNLLLRLREKLVDKETITTYRGVGYAWRC